MTQYAKTFCVYIILIALVLVSCSTIVSNEKALQCEELMRGRWGFGENEFGYEIDNPSNTRYKLASDELGNIFVLDTYNNRVSKFDSTGQFETYITVSQFPGERIVDIAPTADEHLFAAISAPVIVQSNEVEAYVAIYEFDASGQFWMRSADWRDSETLRQRLVAGLGSHPAFYYLVAGPDKSVYSMWLTGEIIQHTPEGLSRLIYNRPWGQVVSGWDGFVYVVGSWGGEDWLLKYEPLNGTLVRRVAIDDFQAVKDGINLGALVGVDAAGRLYFGMTDLSASTEFESEVHVLSNDGRLEERATRRFPQKVVPLGSVFTVILF